MSTPDDQITPSPETVVKLLRPEVWRALRAEVLEEAAEVCERLATVTGETPVRDAAPNWGKVNGQRECAKEIRALKAR